MDQQLHNYYSHSLLCPILFTLIRGATSGQVPIPPIFTPCTFPSPIYQPHKGRTMIANRGWLALKALK
uniref:Secreted protein n=1 Tax=Heterorhabditis bacteriophora TaxID=37862 RepID=A0A1I7WWG4_HETBA